MTQVLAKPRPNAHIKPSAYNSAWHRCAQQAAPGLQPPSSQPGAVACHARCVPWEGALPTVLNCRHLCSQKRHKGSAARLGLCASCVQDSHCRRELAKGSGRKGIWATSMGAINRDQWHWSRAGPRCVQRSGAAAALAASARARFGGRLCGSSVDTGKLGPVTLGTHSGIVTCAVLVRFAKLRQ